MMTDTQLIAIWQEFSRKMKEKATFKLSGREMRIMTEIHRELTERGYESHGGIWSKS